MRNFGLAALMLWSGASATSLTLYDDALRNGFGDSSWAQSADYKLANTTPTYSGADSIKFVARNWGGLQFVASGAEFNVADYQSLTFQINGGSAGGQKLQLYVCDNYDTFLSQTYPLESLIAGGTIPKNAWASVTLDFDAVQMTYGTFNCLVIMDANGNSDAAGQPAVYIDQIVFNARTVAIPNGGNVGVSVDLSANAHPFDPRIFGVAYGDGTRNGQIGYTVRRWGGNSTSRYNWQVDFHNTGSDWYFENIPDCTAASCTGSPPAGNSADTFIAEAKAGGAAPLITIPTIGWTPRPDSATSHPFTVGFAVSKYGAQQSVDPYDTNAGSGNHTNGSPITGNNPADTSVAASPSFEQSWIAHLQSVFGNASGSGVQLYTLDNEVMLWNSTHRDVHPAAPTYDEIWNKTLSYATAIKTQEPNALVTGPVTWGYCDLFSSADDASRGNCVDGTDRQAHGLAFVAWYLQQVCANPLGGGKRLVDYVDLHYYPQGNGVSLSGADDSTTAGLRLRSLKELYDPAWVSESWIGTLGDFDSNHYDKPGLIPRVQAWIDAYCPGTKLAITEYNWGNDGTTSGAVAQAEALAIFARDGVDMATRWVAPGANSKAERGYQIFLNYDGAGAAVQGSSVAATSANIDKVGAYAFRLAGLRSMVLLTNKDTSNHDVTITFNAAQAGTWSLYGFDGAHTLHQVNTGTLSGTALTLYALPPMSANLLVVPDDEIFQDGFQ
jgi:hypothetical protein